MEFRVREAEFADISKLLTACWLGTSVATISEYFSKYFDPEGKRRHFLTGHPDTFLVAEADGKVVGYIHYWTDCWEDYEKYLVSLSVDPSIPAKDALTIRKQLETEMEKDY